MLPELNVKRDNVLPLNQFSGINLNSVIQDGEFSDTKNMTTDFFPMFANRRKRGVLKTIPDCQGMCGGKELAYISGNKFYYAGAEVESLNPTNEERNIVVMGAYVCVFPDGFVFNSHTGEKTWIKNENTSFDSVTFTLAKYDGTPYDADKIITQASEPTDKTKYWIDTSSDPVVMKMYSQSSSMWVSIPTTYIKIQSTGIGIGFKAYDSIYIEGIIEGTWLFNGIKLNNQDLIAYKVDNDSIVVAGFIDKVHSQTESITLKRRLPRLDYVCESGNRIWGCSSSTHELFACKQGDPTNWYAYQGLVEDSYAVTTGSQNPYTGICAYGGYVYAFTEDGYYKVYGNKPSNYEVQFKAGVGVQFGSSKSISVCGDYLIVKARDGFYMYDGSFSSINQKLGSEPFYNAVGASYRGKYYVSMRDRDYNYRIYVFDTTKGTWIIEDDIRARYMVYTNNGLMILDDESEKLFAVNNDDLMEKLFPMDTRFDPEIYHYPNDEFFIGNVVISDSIESVMEWSFTTGDIDLQSESYKYIKRVILRLQLDVNAKMKIEVNYDSSDEWMNVMEIYATRKRSYELPVQIARCDHFKLRFSGFGDMKLFSMAKVVEGGSSI